jgi:predicted metal-binding membrane protein
MAGRRGVIRWHVARNDGSDDAAVVGAHAVALSPDDWQHRRNAPALASVVPIAVGVVVVIAGALQFGARKAHHLACCRTPLGPGRTLPTDVATAWRLGLRLGLHCIYGCAGFTAILLVIGIIDLRGMDLRGMALVTAAITAERLAPNGERVARAIGIVVVG